MKKNVVEITVCDICGREYEIKQGYIGSTAYLIIDTKKDLTVKIDICNCCSKDMFSQVKRIRKEQEKKKNVASKKN